MATSTFGRAFSVSKKNAKEFENKVNKKAEPTLSGVFKTGFTSLEGNPKLKKQLMNALGK